LKTHIALIDQLQQAPFLDCAQCALKRK